MAQPPDDIAASIQTFVSVLRRRLVADRARARQLVVTEAEAYRFATDAVDLDLDRFDELLERSAREPTRVARQSLEQALSLVRGDALEDEPYALWAQDLRGSYQGRVLGARLDAADAALAELDFAAALAHAEAAVAIRPLQRAGAASANARPVRARTERTTPSPATATTASLARRRTRARAHAPRRAHSRLPSSAKRRSGRCSLGRSARHGSTLKHLVVRLLGRVRRAKPTTEASEGESTTVSRSPKSRATTGLGKTRLLDELAARASTRRQDRTRELLAARAAPSLRPARGRPSGRARRRRSRADGTQRFGSSCPSSHSTAEARTSTRSRPVPSRRSSRSSASTLPYSFSSTIFICRSRNARRARLPARDGRVASSRS